MIDRLVLMPDISTSIYLKLVKGRILNQESQVLNDSFFTKEPGYFYTYIIYNRNYPSPGLKFEIETGLLLNNAVSFFVIFAWFRIFIV